MILCFTENVTGHCMFLSYNIYLLSNLMRYLKADVCVYSSNGSLIAPNNVKQFLNNYLAIIFDLKTERNKKIKDRLLLCNKTQY